MKHILLLLACAVATFAAHAQTLLSVSVENTLPLSRADQPVVIGLSAYGAVASALVETEEGEEIACQLDDTDGDEQFDELCFLADLSPRQTRTFTVRLSAEGEPRPYPARVYAELLVRNDKVKAKNRHNNFLQSITARGDCANSYNLLHHHGVCFESELNGMRIYFDKRQTPDLYGKFKKRLELQETQFYTTDEQKAEGYGDDVLWVGNTFGLGALRGWDGTAPTMVEPVKSRTQRIVSYGPLRTIVEIVDKGWQPAPGKPAVNLTLRYTQYAGHRDTDVDATFSPNAAADRFSTGIINVKGSTEFSDHHGLRACWGTDYPASDTLKWKPETVGLAILLPRQGIESEQPANADNYGFVVKTDAQGRLSYKVAYCSANEEFGFRSADEWFGFCRQWRRETEHPIVVRVGSKQ